MIREVTLDVNNTDPIYPYPSWMPPAILKWAVMVGKIDLSEDYQEITNPDGSITFIQDQGPPAMRIFRSP